MEGGVGVTPGCDGSTAWQCAVDTSCGPGSPTTLTGRVFDPAGTHPLYDATVFIPNQVASLPTITPGTDTCNTCDASIGDYVVATQTDAAGSFSLQNVPTGTGVPVTVQIGKWRRTVAVDVPTSCVTTAVPDGTLRLPRRQSEGDMPQMALLTGGCDDIGCFLTNLGIDASEFTSPHGGGRVDVYQGLGLTGNGASLSGGTAGNCTTSSCPLWASKQSFEYYDVAILSCECGEQTSTNESPAAYTNLRDWLNEGGRVLGSHYGYTWFKDNPDPAIQGVATWLGTSLAGGSGTYDLGTAFPKEQAFAQWLGDAGALTAHGPPPTIALGSVASSVGSRRRRRLANETRVICRQRRVRAARRARGLPGAAERLDDCRQRQR